MSKETVEIDGVLARISSLPLARDILRLQEGTRQAGFTAEHIPQALFRHRPILIADGPRHDQQRKLLARFFAPRVLQERHLTGMKIVADRMVREAVNRRETVVDELALHYSVRIASEIIGLNPTKTTKRSKRLTKFFRQPPVDVTRADLGRSRTDWARAAFRGLLPIAMFYLADVRPAIRAHRNKHQGDIISHLLDEGYGKASILMECLTYATAGMITTREFISASLWRLLTDESLRQRFTQGDDTVKSRILHEIIRLEPPVGYLYRRAEAELPVRASCPFAAGQLIGVDVRQTNLDDETFGPDPECIDPDREIPNAERAGLSFGDGTHRCPGQPLAMLETGQLLTRILEEEPEIVSEPSVGWNSLVEGYELRGFTIRFASSQ